MSKVIVSLPQGLVKNCAVGAALALGSYAALQLLCALLIDRGVLGTDALYPLICAAAAVASLLGCGYSVVRGRRVVSVPVVAAVFLALTLAVALLAGDAVAVENGLTGVGLSMAAGALAAALAGYNLPARSARGSRRSRRGRRR